MRVTADMLRAAGACEEQVELFERVFPGGAPVTAGGLAFACDRGLDVSFLARLLPREAVAAVVAACDDGLGEAIGGEPRARTSHSRIEAVAAVQSFFAGWAALLRESMGLLSAVERRHHALVGRHEAARQQIFAALEAAMRNNDASSASHRGPRGDSGLGDQCRGPVGEQAEDDPTGPERGEPQAVASVRADMG